MTSPKIKLGVLLSILWLPVWGFADSDPVHLTDNLSTLAGEGQFLFQAAPESITTDISVLAVQPAPLFVPTANPDSGEALTAGLFSLPPFEPGSTTWDTALPELKTVLADESATADLAYTPQKEVFHQQPATSQSGEGFTMEAETRAAWESLFYYPQQIKQALAPRNNSSTGISQKNSNPLYDEEEASTWDPLEIFKRWGVPKPITIVLLFVLGYLVLAYLARN